MCVCVCVCVCAHFNFLNAIRRLDKSFNVGPKTISPT